MVEGGCGWLRVVKGGCEWIFIAAYINHQQITTTRKVMMTTMMITMMTSGVLTCLTCTFSRAS